MAVPDVRLDVLTKLSNSKKTVPAAIEFVDIAGLVRGASKGEGLGNQFLANIREVDAIAEVVRIFEDDNVIHVEGALDPLRDIETINLELILADLETVTKRLASVERDAKRGEKTAIVEKGALEKIKEALESEKLATSVHLTTDEALIIKGMHLLTAKPFLYVLNKKSGGKNLDEMNSTQGGPVSGWDPRYHKLMNFLNEQKAHSVVVDARIEHELSELDPNEKDTYRGELGATDDGINNLIRGGYDLLGLITYFTTGEDETRAWTVKYNSTAPVAGMAIHTDFKDKFIRAEVVAYDDLVRVGSYAKAREQGLVRTEGKEYIVKDGDVIEFKI